MSGQGQRTQQYLPNPRSKEAPPKFRGQYYKIWPFFLHYEHLLNSCEISDAKEKCEYVLLYVGFKVAKLVKVLPEFTSHDWDKLKNKLLHLYDADQDIARYTLADLHHLTKKALTRPL